LITETPWFFDFKKHAMESIIWGHSLIELIPGIDLIDKAVLIPRINVKPEIGLVALDAYNESNGINYETDPLYSKRLISVGGKKDYGLLMTAAQYVIYKRGGFGDWAQFAELFGMPFRVGEYDPFDAKSRQLLDEALSKMGGAGYAVIPKGSSIEIKEAGGTGQSQIFQDLIKTCNEEISKLFLGQTMTTDNGSSRSQSEVHKDVEDEITMSDILWLEYFLNWELKYKLIDLGYSGLENGKFKFNLTNELPLEKQIEIDLKVASKVNIDPVYFYEKYGVPMPDGKPSAVALPQPDGGEGEKKFSAQHDDTCCPINPYNLTLSTDIKLSSEEEDWLFELYNNPKSNSYEVVKYQNTISQLRKAMLEGFGGVETDYNRPDYMAQIMMELNINRFGFDKTISEIVELNNAVRISSNFNEFKEQASRILGKYNVNYLQTEYNLAHATAQNAARWNEQKAQANIYPYLKYVTVGDDRVRNSHRALDGKIFKFNDTSWRSIYPPNGFGCRCEMIQLRPSEIDSTNVIDGNTAKALLGEEYKRMEKSGFAVNRGETKQIFELNKAYLGQNLNDFDWKSAKMESADKIIKAQLSEIPKNVTATRESVIQEFDKTAKDGIKTYTDHSGKTLLLHKKTLLEHLSQKYIEIGRDKIFENINSTLLNADEVWLNQKGEKFHYNYIKYYKDGYMIVPVDIIDGKLIIKTWYSSNEKNVDRKGVLIKK
jgi:SPP1 gp7 family putative phage head morphogenesis protein